MDPDCRVCHALEYQGTGHHREERGCKGAGKKEVLRKAAIEYHKVVVGHTTPGN